MLTVAVEIDHGLVIKSSCIKDINCKERKKNEFLRDNCSSGEYSWKKNEKEIELICPPNGSFWVVGISGIFLTHSSFAYVVFFEL